MGSIIFFVVVVAIVSRAAVYYRRRQIEPATVSFIASVMYVVCLWIPSNLQSSGRIQSKLVGPGVMAPPTPAEISDLSVAWATELTVVVVAEMVVVYVVGMRISRVRALKTTEYEAWLLAALLLIGAGLVAAVAFPISLDDRANAGQGVVSILKSCLVCGLAILAFFRCFHRRWLFAVLMLGLVILVLGNVRSPLSVIVIAWVCGMISNGSLYKKRWLATGCALAIFAVAVGSFMSEMRANVTRGEGMTTLQVAEQVVSDPLAAPYGAGIDTLDGYRFSQYASVREPAEPMDLLSPLYTFVPRALWPGKPSSISSRLSSKYLGYKSSGQFLSLVGYLRLVSGSYGLSLALLAVTIALLTGFILRFQGTPWSVIGYVCAFRLFLNGTAFDVYYSLALTVPIVCARGLGGFVSSTLRRASVAEVRPSGLLDDGRVW